MNKDKRAHFRKALSAEAWVADALGNTWSTIDLMDISGGGAAFIAKEQLAAGSSRMFRFQLPGGVQRIGFIGRIVHTAKHTFLDGYRTGVEFIRIDAGDRALIERFIQESTGDPG